MPRIGFEQVVFLFRKALNLLGKLRPPWEVANRTARTSCWRDASQVPTAPLAQITEGLICKSVQIPGGNVLLKLLIPRRGIELGEPVAESQKLLAGKLANGSFDFVDGTHVRKIRRSGFHGKHRSGRGGTYTDRNKYDSFLLERAFSSATTLRTQRGPSVQLRACSARFTPQTLV
jgi:hypothetical protein